MKFFVILITVLALSLAKSVTLLKSSELTDELLNNPRYLVYEKKEGLFEIEDLENNSDVNITLTADDNDVTFYFYAYGNSNSCVQIRASDAKNIAHLTGFKLNRDTLVVIHGWRNNYESNVNCKIKTTVLAERKVNVIVVDWSHIAQGLYISAQGSVLAVGNFVGDFLIALNKELGYSLSRITIAGHSLGAHVAGNAGARVGGVIPVIIGLDPAGPLFSSTNINNRLDPTDAKYVHVIHTNAGLLGFGIKMGDVDYYPNGGSFQPGCGIDIAGTCAHGRSYEYFAESCSNNNFLSRLCDTYHNFQHNLCNSNNASYLGGYPVAKSSDGNYYLTTNDRSPFAKG